MASLTSTPRSTTRSSPSRIGKADHSPGHPAVDKASRGHGSPPLLRLRSLLKSLGALLKSKASRILTFGSKARGQVVNRAYAHLPPWASGSIRSQTSPPFHTTVAALKSVGASDIGRLGRSHRRPYNVKFFTVYAASAVAVFRRSSGVFWQVWRNSASEDISPPSGPGKGASDLRGIAASAARSPRQKIRRRIIRGTLSRP
jgi:hypothetical protein